MYAKYSLFDMKRAKSKVTKIGILGLNLGFCKVIWISFVMVNYLKRHFVTQNA